jgi:hypothetical protein
LSIDCVSFNKIKHISLFGYFQSGFFCDFVQSPTSSFAVKTVMSKKTGMILNLEIDLAEFSIQAAETA